MSRFLISMLLCTGLCFSARADHITGGELFYTYTGEANGTLQYNFTLKEYMRCYSGRNFNNPAIISIFRKSNYQRVMDINVPLSSQQNLQLTNPDPCISNPPDVCYEVGYWNFQLSLPASPDGYIVAAQVTFRINTISNLQSGYSQVGATYMAVIPGTSNGRQAEKNNSAHFTGDDLVIVCAENPFTYSFAAEDADGDKLQYYFCEAYRQSNQSTGGGMAVAPANPPYTSVPYGNPYSGDSPLGASVQIDSETGMISGIAPPAGTYIVTVCIDEIRDGQVIATQRKDLQINIASCEITAAKLLPEYLLCRNTTAITLSNLSGSTLVRSYFWEFSNKDSSIIYTSTDPQANYNFTDTGIYYAKLVINRNEACSDSTTTLIRVYPGFIPAIRSTGICITKPTRFFDATTTRYGRISSWYWDFGEPAVFNDTSLQQNPVYTYPSLGSKAVQMIVSNTNGCRDTIINTIAIIDKPPITLAFRDTLMCIRDNVQLQATGIGSFNWTPAVSISNANTGTPTVSPPATTVYKVTLTESGGCVNTDSVKVRVTSVVQLKGMNDTTICSGDTILLRVESDGFQYTWSPTASLVNATIKNPLAHPIATTTYQVRANIGSCTATDDIKVTTVPYPIAYAGNDTSICFNAKTILHGASNGSFFIWTPAATLSNARILNPEASPRVTTQYILSATDNKGCPKPGLDSVTITVMPDIKAFAGKDTAIVTGQILQLQASGGTRYEWVPASGLSNPNIANPFALFDEGIENIRYKVLVYDGANCVDSAFIHIKVFSTPPTVFVPTAFTPNGDGKNDALRPIAAGILHIELFSVYDRWGRLVFSTTQSGKGWDGRVNGQLQPSNSYVWMVKAVDYKGQPYLQKGMATLIR